MSVSHSFLTDPTSPLDAGRRLRQLTQHAHRRLDRHPLMAAFETDPPYFLDWATAYLAVATGFSHVLIGCASSDKAALQLASAARLHDAVDAYCADINRLQAVGFMIPKGVAVGSRSLLPAFKGPAAVGALWCLSGSRRGAAVLYRRAARSFTPEQLESFSAWKLLAGAPEEGHQVITRALAQCLSGSDGERAAFDGAERAFNHITAVADRFSER